MAKPHIISDVEATRLSESRQLQASHLSESSSLSVSLPIVNLEFSMQNELAKLQDHHNCTIFRTPHIISQSQKNLFEPSAISIGPFHRGRKHLRVMEKQKWQSLQDFLSHGNTSLAECISAMESLETRTRRCYSETFDDLPSNAFVEMMLLDGCFVLKYFSKFSKFSIEEVGWNSIFIKRDLLLLENQIPFFIVEELYEIGNLNQEQPKNHFVKYIAGIFFSLGLTKDMESMISNHPADIPDPIGHMYSIIPDPPAEIHHLVHLCYHYLVPQPENIVVLSSMSFELTNRIKGFILGFLSRVLTRRFPNSTGNISSMVIPSTTELKRMGLKFTPKSNPKHMLDISFEYGVLKIPRLEITDSTKHIFTNLIAFEHSKYGKRQKPFTRFVAFLDNLVNTPNDVTILQKCGIVENWLGSEEEVAHFINQLVTECNVFASDHFLAKLYTEVNRYIGSSWNRQRAKLVRDYFSSPWATISVIAAFILLVLTLVQSFFAVFAYFRPPKP